MLTSKAIQLTKVSSSLGGSSHDSTRSMDHTSILYNRGASYVCLELERIFLGWAHFPDSIRIQSFTILHSTHCINFARLFSRQTNSHAPLHTHSITFVTGSLPLASQRK